MNRKQFSHIYKKEIGRKEIPVEGQRNNKSTVSRKKNFLEFFCTQTFRLNFFFFFRAINEPCNARKKRK